MTGLQAAWGWAGAGSDTSKPSLCPFWVSWFGTCYADIEAARQAEVMQPPIVPPPAPETRAELEHPEVWSAEFWQRYYAEQAEARRKFEEANKLKCAWYQVAVAEGAGVCKTDYTKAGLIAGFAGLLVLILVKR